MVNKALERKNPHADGRHTSVKSNIREILDLQLCSFRSTTSRICFKYTTLSELSSGPIYFLVERLARYA